MPLDGWLDWKFAMLLQVLGEHGIGLVPISGKELGWLS